MRMMMPTLRAPDAPAADYYKPFILEGAAAIRYITAGAAERKRIRDAVVAEAEAQRATVRRTAPVAATQTQHPRDIEPTRRRRSSKDFGEQETLSMYMTETVADAIDAHGIAQEHDLYVGQSGPGRYYLTGTRRAMEMVADTLIVATWGQPERNDIERTRQRADALLGGAQ